MGQLIGKGLYYSSKILNYFDFLAPVQEEPSIPKLKRQDMTLEQLRKYDGTDEHGRLCLAVNGKVFDVTKGKKFYGPGHYPHSYNSNFNHYKRVRSVMVLVYIW